MADGGGGPPAAFLPPKLEVGRARLPGRGLAGNYAGPGGQEAKEGQRSCAHRQAVPVTEVLDHIGRHTGPQDVDSPDGHYESQSRAESGKQDTLSEQLAEDTPSASSQRRAKGDLPLPASGARKLEVRDVGARDEQNEADSAHQQQHKLAGGLVDNLLAESNHS